MTPAFQAYMDWRECGEFMPTRYPAGSDEFRQYMAEKSIIEAGEEFNHEQRNPDTWKERNGKDSIIAEPQPIGSGADSGSEKAAAF